MKSSSLLFSSISIALVLSACAAGCAAEEEEDEGGTDNALTASKGSDLASIADSAKEKGDVSGIPFVPASKGGWSEGRPDNVQFVVIHDIEGSGRSGVETFRDPKAVVSAHYVIDKFGVAVQMVREANTAKHSGSTFFNGAAIGIEHAGYMKSGGFTAAEYAASAKLVASIVSRYKIPVDREHIVGHSQVPSVEDEQKACVPAATTCGGRNHHGDPGPNWDWKGYLEKVKAAVAALPQSTKPTSPSTSSSTTKPPPPPVTTLPTETRPPVQDTTPPAEEDPPPVSTGGGAACGSDGACNPGNDGSGLICVSGRCVPGCRSNAHCPGTTVCTAGQCR